MSHLSKLRVTPYHIHGDIVHPQKIYRNKWKGNNYEKKQTIKKVKGTILKYVHIGIYVKISASRVKNEVCRTAIDK